jgi:hypothetical protein
MTWSQSNKRGVYHYYASMQAATQKDNIEVLCHSATTDSYDFITKMLSVYIHVLSKVEKNFLKITEKYCWYRYIFPGLALGAALGQTGVITNAMINRAAEVSTRQTVWVR